MERTTDLASQLREVQEASRQRMDPARYALMENATRTLRATGIETSSTQVGDAAPDVTLPDATGAAVSLATLWSRGPLIVVFYRGGWCPYCNLGLRAWQSHLPEVAARGATLVAISPQTPDHSLSTVEKNALAFPVLSDSMLAAADGFGVTFTMAPELQALYAASGNDLAVLNGNGLWKLPIPATFVIDANGVVALADIDADYRVRAEPSVVLAAVSDLAS